jgi:hypothetical protein
VKVGSGIGAPGHETQVELRAASPRQPQAPLRAQDRSTAPGANAASVAHRLSAHARRFMLVSATLLVASCSSIKLGYNNAEWLLVYSLDSYLDLDERQETLLRERARTLVGWHRATQLRDYAQVLDATAGRLRNPVSADDVLAFQDQVNAKMAAVGAHAAPDLAELAATLTPAQLDHLSSKLANDTSKARRELVRFAGRESTEERVRRFIERAESWFGPLRPEQVELVRESFARRPVDQEFWMAERERRQRDIVDVLTRIRNERPAHDTATRWLREYFAQLVLPAEPARRERVLAFRRMNAELLAALLNGATPEQRASAQKKLRGYADDFTTLAAALPRSG